MLTSGDMHDLNAAEVGDIVTLEDGRKFKVENEGRWLACKGACDLYQEECFDITCTEWHTVYKLVK